MNFFFFFPVRNIVLSLETALGTSIIYLLGKWHHVWQPDEQKSKPYPLPETHIVLFWSYFFTFTVLAESTLVHNCNSLQCFLSNEKRVWSREPDKYLEDLKEWWKLVRKILSHVVMSRLGKQHCVVVVLRCQIFYGLFTFFSENM